MRDILQELRVDDEQMLLTEYERLVLREDLNICESDFTVWASVYESRNKEKDDITDGVKMMRELQQVRTNERDSHRKDLDNYRTDLPACIGLLINFAEASNAAASLNSTIENSFSVLSSADTALAIAQTAGVGNRSWVSETPAEIIRHKLKQDGFRYLALEEQQWVTLDRSLNPSLYYWLVEQEELEKEAELRALSLKPGGSSQNKYGANRTEGAHPSKSKQQSQLHPSIEHYKWVAIVI